MSYAIKTSAVSFNITKKSTSYISVLKHYGFVKQYNKNQIYYICDNRYITCILPSKILILFNVLRSLITGILKNSSKAIRDKNDRHDHHGNYPFFNKSKTK